MPVWQVWGAGHSLFLMHLREQVSVPTSHLPLLPQSKSVLHACPDPPSGLSQLPLDGMQTIAVPPVAGTPTGPPTGKDEAP